MRILDVDTEPLGPVPLPEVSGLALGEDRHGLLTVVAVGDRTATVAWAAVEHGVDDLRWVTEDLSESTAGEFSAALLLRLHGVGRKPEGLAILPNGDVLVACDRKRRDRNLYVVRRAAWRHLH